MKFSGRLRSGLLESARAASPEEFAQVGEWLKPTDCKSVPPSEVRRFESFPVHHLSRLAGVGRTLSPLAKSRAVFCEGSEELLDFVSR